MKPESLPPLFPIPGQARGRGLDELFPIERAALHEPEHGAINARPHELDDVIGQRKPAGRIAVMEKPERRIEPEPDKRPRTVPERDRVTVIERGVARVTRPSGDKLRAALLQPAAKHRPDGGAAIGEPRPEADVPAPIDFRRSRLDHQQFRMVARSGNALQRILRLALRQFAGLDFHRQDYACDVQPLLRRRRELRPPEFERVGARVHGRRVGQDGERLAGAVHDENCDPLVNREAHRLDSHACAG
jgi:hypothetical protein